jgi:hypothetical protein
VDAAARIKVVLDRARRQQLVVLVWGPGDPGPHGSRETKKYWKKRNQIRDLLAKEFKESQVYFSESDALRDHTRDLDTMLTEELVHAAVADCILVLDISRGAHVEVDRFSTYPVLAKKLRVLLPQKYVGGSGLVSEVHSGLRVIGFTDAEFRNCTLASEKAIKTVLSVAIEKLMASA